jgi:hypothetical protein
MLRFLFSAIAMLLVLPILAGLLRRVVGGDDPADRPGASPRDAARGRRGGRRAGTGDETGIDRSSVIDVPFTEEEGDPSRRSEPQGSNPEPR